MSHINTYVDSNIGKHRYIELENIFFMLRGTERGWTMFKWCNILCRKNTSTRNVEHFSWLHKLLALESLVWNDWIDKFDKQVSLNNHNFTEFKWNSIQTQSLRCKRTHLPYSLIYSNFRVVKKQKIQATRKKAYGK